MRLGRAVPVVLPRPSRSFPRRGLSRDSPNTVPNRLNFTLRMAGAMSRRRTEWYHVVGSLDYGTTPVGTLLVSVSDLITKV